MKRIDDVFSLEDLTTGIINNELDRKTVEADQFKDAQLSVLNQIKKEVMLHRGWNSEKFNIIINMSLCPENYIPALYDMVLATGLKALHPKSKIYNYYDPKDESYVIDMDFISELEFTC